MACRAGGEAFPPVQQAEVVGNHHIPRLPLVSIEVAGIIESLVQILQEGALILGRDPLDLQRMLVEEANPLAAARCSA